MKQLPTLSLISLLIGAFVVQAQQLQKPELAFDFACASSSHNQFKTSVTFKNAVFRGNNVFYLELSDGLGNFDSPTVLKTITDKNYAFKFDITFSLPKTVEGEQYKLRVRATMPEKISPESATFHAFYIADNNLVLNNYENVTICDSSATTISLDKDISNTYHWYKNGVFYKEAGPSLVVTETGKYYAEPYFGNCTGTVFSNKIQVTLGTAFQAKIEGPSQLNICPNKQQTLKATISNNAIDYQWYFNGVAINHATESSYTFTTATETYGVYTVKMQKNGCESLSEGVRIEQPHNNLQVEAVSKSSVLVWKDVQATLELKSNYTNIQVRWFKNETEVSSGDNLTLDVQEVGTYYALITIVGSCNEAIKSPTFHVHNPDGFLVTLQAEGSYDACVSTDTTIGFYSLEAYTNNGTKQDLETVIVDDLDLHWFHNNTQTQYTQPSVALQTHTQSGLYYVNGTYCGIPLVSNRLNVQLGFSTPILESDKELACENQLVQLNTTLVSDAIYTWYKDGELLEETLEAYTTANGPGTYKVYVNYEGCVANAETKVSPIDENLLQLSHDPLVFIQTNEVISINASGADGYFWTDADGYVLSKQAMLEVRSKGIYYVIGVFGDCEIQKKIEVKENNVGYVTNIISPNNDNINDKWVIPAKFVNDPEVEVTILNGNGTEVYKTVSYQNNWPQTAIKNHDVYYYLIRKNGTSVAKGSITVIGS